MNENININENESSTAIAAKETTAVATVPTEALGFEDTRNDDIIIPRIKVINALSPERQDGVAAEGDVINSLTQENVSGKRFIPIKQYYSCIYWNPERGAEQRMLCRSFDGRIGESDDGARNCMQCPNAQWDNSKTGKDAAPKCTQYINFLGFFSDSPMPVVLSFAKTNYNEGKKMLSMARSMRTSIWGYAYTIGSRLMSKDRNKWYNLAVTMAGPATDEEKTLAFEVFQAYNKRVIDTDYEDTGKFDGTDGTSADVEAEI